MLAALMVAGCQDGYPIAATRCDRWCDIRQATECGNYNPAGCVVGCEQLSGGAACQPAFDDLLTCLEEHQQDIKCDNAHYGMVPACEPAQATLYTCAMHGPHGPDNSE